MQNKYTTFMFRPKDLLTFFNIKIIDFKTLLTSRLIP